MSLALLVVGLLATLPARAALVGDLTIRLVAPGGIVGDATPIDLSDTLPALDGTLLAPGDGSSIGSFLLPLERVALSGQVLQLTVATGAVVAGQMVTGYLGLGSAHARYEFSGLAVPGMTIVGLTLGSFDGFAASGFNGLAAPADLAQGIRLTSPTSLSVDLDTLSFRDRGLGESLNVADLRIELQTVPVPEPASALLALAGLALLAVRRRG